MQIKEIALTRIRYGYRRIHVLLKHEGWKINQNQVYRIYCQEGLNLRSKTKRKHLAVTRAPDKNMAVKINECWTMDFVSDQLYNGKRFRALTVLDMFSRECLAIYVDQSIKAEMVACILETLKAARGVPRRIKTDNGSDSSRG